MDEHQANGNDTWHLAPTDDTPPHKPRIKWNALALACIVLGILLFCAGWLSGSRGGRIYFRNGITIVTHEEMAENARAVDLTFANTFSEITVDSGSGRVVLVPTQDARISVVRPYARQIDINENGATLEISARSGNHIGLFNFGLSSHGFARNRGDRTLFLDLNFDFANFTLRNISNELRVYVPASVNEINVRTYSGSINMEDINTNSLNLRASSGRINLTGGTHSNVRMQTSSGSINGNAYFTGDIYARASSGRVSIQDNSTSHSNVNNGIRLGASSGSVTFSTRAPINDFSYSISVSSGSMRVDGSRISGRSTSGGAGRVPINVSTSSGSANLNFNQ